VHTHLLLSCLPALDKQLVPQLLLPLLSVLRADVCWVGSVAGVAFAQGAVVSPAYEVLVAGAKGSLLPLVAHAALAGSAGKRVHQLVAVSSAHGVADDLCLVLPCSRQDKPARLVSLCPDPWDNSCCCFTWLLLLLLLGVPLVLLSSLLLLLLLLFRLLLLRQQQLLRLLSPGCTGCPNRGLRRAPATRQAGPGSEHHHSAEDRMAMTDGIH